MKQLSLIVLTLSLVSCRSTTNLGLRKVSEQCSPVFVYVDESQKLIDVDKSYCNVREYEFSLNYVGSVAGTASKKPLPYCDRCVGFKKYADTATFWETVRQAIVSDVNSEE